ncbi:hypothetical protein GCM10009654_46310 [Streptomyces hebeiensis]|uniref:DUF721 domain-containing protein n=1 Tax=Streptomyces hebeiensis TaxID=229486 RepID=A0ABN1UZ75_9ACTN
MKRDGREPSGAAAGLAGLMADRARELPAAGGSVLDRWPDMAAAVAFHSETGQLDLCPDFPAYATQLRLITARIVATANESAGTNAVRNVRVLPSGTAPAPRTTPEAPAAAPDAPQMNFTVDSSSPVRGWRAVRSIAGGADSGGARHADDLEYSIP